MRVAQFSRLHPTAHPQGAHTVSCQMRSRNCRRKAVRVLNVFMGVIRPRVLPSEKVQPGGEFGGFTGKSPGF